MATVVGKWKNKQFNGGRWYVDDVQNDENEGIFDLNHNFR